MSEEKALFGIIGDGRDPDTQLQPRANKPDTYGLYVDGELVNAYGTAYEALKGLRDEPATRRQVIELRDMNTTKLAEKRLVDVQNTTNLLRSAHVVPKLYLTDDMKRDLISEGRDPAHPFRDVQPARTHEASVWFKQLQSITAQLKHERAASVERERIATPDMARSTPAAPDRQSEASSPQQASSAPVVRPAKQAAPKDGGLRSSSCSRSLPSLIVSAITAPSVARIRTLRSQRQQCRRSSPSCRPCRRRANRSNSSRIVRSRRLLHLRTRSRAAPTKWTSTDARFCVSSPATCGVFLLAKVPVYLHISTHIYIDSTPVLQYDWFCGWLMA